MDDAAHHVGRLATCIENREFDAAETALGRANGADASLPTGEIETLTADAESFVAARARFARAVSEGESRPDDTPSAVGDPTAVRETTDGIVEAITTPDADDECPHCGLALPAEGAPLCPRCGAPR